MGLAGKLGQLARAARSRHGHVAQVMVEVETGVVRPDGSKIASPPT